MNAQSLAGSGAPKAFGIYNQDDRSPASAGTRPLFQLDLFDLLDEATPSEEAGGECVGPLRLTTDNFHVQMAMDSNWWNDAQALSDFKMDLRRDLGQMVALHGVHGAQYPEDEAEIRNACRILATRISELQHEPE